MVWKPFRKDKLLKDPLSDSWTYFLYMWKVGCLQCARFIWVPVFSTYIQLFLPGLTGLRSPPQALQHLPHPPVRCFLFIPFSHRFWQQNLGYQLCYCYLLLFLCSSFPHSIWPYNLCCQSANCWRHWPPPPSSMTMSWKQKWILLFIIHLFSFYKKKSNKCRIHASQSPHLYKKKKLKNKTKKNTLTINNLNVAHQGELLWTQRSWKRLERSERWIPPSTAALWASWGTSVGEFPSPQCPAWRPAPQYSYLFTEELKTML